MNNNFKEYIKKSEKRLNKNTIIIGIVSGVFATLNVAFNISLFILIPLALLIAFIVIMISVKKENNTVKKYDLGMDIDSNIYIQLTYDLDYLKEIDKLLEDNNNTEECNNLIDYIDNKIKNKKIVFLEDNFDLKEAIPLLNDLLRDSYKLDYNEIVGDEQRKIKTRRKDKINTSLPDLASIRYNLEKNGYELIRFYTTNIELSKKAQINGFILSIIKIDKVEALRKIEYKRFYNH